MEMIMLLTGLFAIVGLLVFLIVSVYNFMTKSNKERSDGIQMIKDRRNRDFSSNLSSGSTGYTPISHGDTIAESSWSDSSDSSCSDGGSCDCGGFD
jgi:hypothetical protein